MYRNFVCLYRDRNPCKTSPTIKEVKVESSDEGSICSGSTQDSTIHKTSNIETLQEPTQPPINFIKKTSTNKLILYHGNYKIGKNLNETSIGETCSSGKDKGDLGRVSSATIQRIGK